jgi:sigma-B regulation protein RsbU (phosphoserine phosphatase)
VSGKGIAASLVMANLQATIRGQMLFDPDPQNCLARANTLLYRSTDSRTFVSLFFGVLDIQRHTLVYANAGQDIPLLVAVDGTIRTLPIHGIALGIKEHVSYETGEVTIADGDRILVYSDGIPEAMDLSQTEFGEQRLTEALMRAEALSATRTIESIIASVQRHANGAAQSDDMTVVMVKREREMTDSR